MTDMKIMRRKKRLHLNDPRCYNGVYFDAEHVWGPWELLNICATLEDAQDKLTFWQELNDYAVSQRGDSAKCEFKITEELL